MAFASPKWFLSYYRYSIFNVKTAPLIRQLLGSTNCGLSGRIFLYSRLKGRKAGTFCNFLVVTGEDVLLHDNSNDDVGMSKISFVVSCKSLIKILKKYFQFSTIFDSVSYSQWQIYKHGSI